MQARASRSCANGYGTRLIIHGSAAVLPTGLNFAISLHRRQTERNSFYRAPNVGLRLQLTTPSFYGYGRLLVGYRGRLDQHGGWHTDGMAYTVALDHLHLRYISTTTKRTLHTAHTTPHHAPHCTHSDTHRTTRTHTRAHAPHAPTRCPHLHTPPRTPYPHHAHHHAHTRAHHHTTRTLSYFLSIMDTVEEGCARATFRTYACHHLLPPATTCYAPARSFTHTAHTHRCTHVPYG